MAFFVVWHCWRWPLRLAALADRAVPAHRLVFLAANMLKILEGGWLPLLVGAALMIVMLTWGRGARVWPTSAQGRGADWPSSSRRWKAAAARPGHRGVPDRRPELDPDALLHNLKHNRVLHEHNVILNVAARTPRARDVRIGSRSSGSPTHSPVIRCAMASWRRRTCPEILEPVPRA